MKYFTSFPYLKFYQDKGYKVIGAPTALGNTDNQFNLPHYERFIANIREFGHKCIQNNAEGMVTTAWYNLPPEILYWGLIATSQYSWG